MPVYSKACDFVSIGVKRGFSGDFWIVLEFDTSVLHTANFIEVRKCGQLGKRKGLWLGSHLLVHVA